MPCHTELMVVGFSTYLYLNHVNSILKHSAASGWRSPNLQHQSQEAKHTCSHNIDQCFRGSVTASSGGDGLITFSAALISPPIPVKPNESENKRAGMAATLSKLLVI